MNKYELLVQIEEIFGEILRVSNTEDALSFNVMFINTKEFKNLSELIIKNNYDINIEWDPDTTAVRNWIGK